MTSPTTSAISRPGTVSMVTTGIGRETIAGFLTTGGWGVHWPGCWPYAGCPGGCWPYGGCGYCPPGGGCCPYAGCGCPYGGCGWPYGLGCWGCPYGLAGF